jgi:hypothetical protein
MTTQDRLLAALDRATASAHPLRHWQFRQILPAVLAEALTMLPFAAVSIRETEGRRETHSALRRFCTLAAQSEFPACVDLAAAFRAPATTRRIEALLCGIDLAGTSLRIELCPDGACHVLAFPEWPVG